MSNQNNFDDSEKEKTDEKPFLKGWKNFIDGAKDGFSKFTASLEKQAMKNEEFWEENKEKVDGFFNKVKQDWDNKMKQWNADMEQRSLETKEQWEARKSKIQQDIKSWQEKTQEKWDDGVKSFRKGFFRLYLWALLLIVPVIVIVVIVIRVLGI
jgi:hypothetical protein